MRANGYLNVAQALELLGGEPATVAAYDAIVKAFSDGFFEKLTGYTAMGQPGVRAALPDCLLLAGRVQLDEAACVAAKGADRDRGPVIHLHATHDRVGVSRRPGHPSGGVSRDRRLIEHEALLHRTLALTASGRSPAHPRTIL